MTTHLNYTVHKLRMGRDGTWEPWAYEAVSSTPNYQPCEPSTRGITGRHESVDALARELATFPDILNATLNATMRPQRQNTVFVSQNDPFYVSLFREDHIGNVVMTQRAEATPEELGELARLVIKYHRG